MASRSVWNYCTFDRTALILFAFDLYDLDGSGKIDAKEMKRILREVYGVGPGKDDLIEREARKIEGMAAPGVSARGEHQTIGGFITQAHFKDFVDRHPTVRAAIVRSCAPRVAPHLTPSPSSVLPAPIPPPCRFCSRCSRCSDACRRSWAGCPSGSE